MGIVIGLLAVIAFVASLLLMVVVLLQEPKGGGIAAALGGSGMEAVGVNTGSVNKFTSWVAGIWIVACLLHSMLMEPMSRISVDEGTGSDTATETDSGSDSVSPPPETPAKDE